MNTSALDTQIGGTHYKSFAIQPVVYSHKNQLSFLAGCVLKRLCRYNQPSGKGKQDLEKAIHELQILIELNHEIADEPPAFLTSINDLRIHPATFCLKNKLDYWQLIVVERITLYNRDEGGAYMLQEAVDMIADIIAEKYPN